MKPIGGYFSLELSHLGGFPHDDGILLNSGRNALEFILRAVEDIRMLHVPYYTCEVVLEPLAKLGIPYTHYHIDERLEIKEKLILKKEEYLLYTNYFGIKDRYCQQLACEYGDHLIVDNAQALFANPLDIAGTVYSVRKFIGVPDGGIAFTANIQSAETLSQGLQQDKSYERCSHLLKRFDAGAEAGYVDFHKNEDGLIGQPIKRMSELTKALLHNIDFEKVKTARWNNFIQLQETLKNFNQLSPLISSSAFACPMVYPFLTEDTDLRKKLIDNQIFVATYWPNVLDWCEAETIESYLAKNLLPLPIDQRYAKGDMNRIIISVKE